MLIRHLKSLTTLLASVALLLAGCSGPTEPAPRAAATANPVTVLEARYRNSYVRTQTLTGRVEANRQSEIGFELAGMLNDVRVDEGDRVTAGQSLATLATERLLARRAELQALADQASVQEKLAAITLERMKEALNFRGISQQEYDEAENRAQSASASLTATRSRLKSVDVDLQKSTLAAPFNATITRRHLDEGQVLQPGQAVLSLQENDSMIVRLGVAGAALETMDVGSAHTFTVDDVHVDTIVRQRLPQRDRVSRTVDVIFEVTHTSAPVRVGDLARLDVETTIADRGLWLPIEALAEGQRGLWTVYVAVPAKNAAVGATHSVEPRPVEMIYQDTNKVFVRGTLQDGDSIIAGGLQRVVPGQAVRLATAPPAEQPAL